MAAEAQKRWLNQMQSPIREMTKVALTITNFALPHPTVGTVVPRMQMLHQTLVRIVESMLPLSRERPIKTQAELAPIVMEFIKFLQAVVPHLDRLGCRLSLITASSIGTPEEQVFWELWKFLAAGCYAFKAAKATMPCSWSEDDLPMYHSLYVAFHKLLSWLLCFTRSPAWRLMRSEHGLAHRSRELWLILQQPMRCLVDVSGGPRPIVLSHLQSAPAQLIPLLCCIVSEQLGTPPLLVSQAQLTAGMIATSYMQGLDLNYPVTALQKLLPPLAFLFDNLLDKDGSPEHLRSLLSYVTVPAVIHFLKGIIILSGKSGVSTAQTSDTESGCSSLLGLSFLPLKTLLNTIFRAEMQDPCSTQLSATDRHINQDLQGLPMHANPFLSKQALETDVQLLHALSKHMDADITLMLVCCKIQYLVVFIWAQAGRIYPTPADVLAVMSRSILGLVKQCLGHGLQLMQQQKQITSKSTSEQQQQGEHATAREREVKRSVWESPDVKFIQTFLMVLSDYKVQTESGKVTPTHAPGSEVNLVFRKHTMPGWIAVTEALARGHCRTLNFEDMSNTAVIAANSMLMICRSRDTSALAASLSLSTSVCKQFRRVLCPTTIMATSARGQACKELWAKAAHFFYSYERIVVPAVASLTRLHAYSSGASSSISGGSSTSGCSSSSGGSSTSTSYATNFSSSSKGTSCRHSGACGGADGTSVPEKWSHPEPQTWQSQVGQVEGWSELCGERASNRTSGAIDQTAQLHPFLAQQLLAINLLTVVQVHRWTVQLACCDPEQMTLVRQLCRRLPFKDLKELVTSLLSLSTISFSEVSVSALWEQYAATHLHGRLTPGCCHLGCTNLDGVSEATLKTQLCSGCRRARYCSVECQEAAWLEGGHITVCGKHKAQHEFGFP